MNYKYMSVFEETEKSEENKKGQFIPLGGD